MRRPTASVRSIVVATIAGIFVTIVLTTSVGAHASSDSAPSYVDRLLALVNAARQQHGEEPLALVPGPTAVAAAWTQHLADAHALSHNPRLAHQLEVHGSRTWLTYGENVGVGSADDPDGLFDAYMNSPEHRANILTADYRYVGVAVVIAGSRAWNTFDFVDVYDAAPTEHAASRRARPAVTTAVTHPVAAPAATVPTPLVRSTQRAARPTGPVVVHVQALHRPTPQQPVTAVASVPAPAWAGRLVASTGPAPGHRATPGAVAIALMALSLAARRWVLAAR